MIIYDPKITGSFQINGSTISSVEQIDTISGSVDSLTAASSSFSTRVTGVEGSVTSLNSATGSYATQTYVTTALNNLIDAAPASLDTLNELAAALNDDANFATTVTNSLATKLNLSGGTLTGDLIVNTNIGIGTSSPATKLNIRTDASDDGILLEKTDGTDIARLFYDGSSTNGRLDMFSGGIAKVQIHTNGTSHFSGGNVGIGTSSASGKLTINTLDENHIRLENGVELGVIRLLDSGILDIYSHGETNNEITFTNGTGSGVERMRIDASGNVGIGTSSPSGVGTTLNLRGTGDANSSLKISSVISESYDGATFVSLYSGIGGADVPSIIFPSSGLRFGQGNKSTSTYSEKMRITSAGNVGIGTSSPATKLQVVGGIRFSSSGADANRWSVYWNGSSGDLIVVNNISDIRAKTDLDYDIKGLETVQKLKPVKFTWKDGKSHSTSVSGRLRQYGFIAQETMEADDYLAWHNEEQDTWGIEQYESFSAVMVKAIQEQQEIINDLKLTIETLKSQINA